MVEPVKLSFKEYKIMKDEIIDICEKRFEVVLLRKFKEFKDEMIEIIDQRFEASNRQNEKNYMHLMNMMKIFMWVLGIFITIYIASYSIIINSLLSK